MRPDLRRDEDVARPGPAQSIGSRSARFSSRQFRSAEASSDRGVFCDLIAIVAAVPAAWPIAMHVAIERAEAWASCVAEKQRPATSMPSTPSGSRHLYGIPYTPPPGTYVHLVSGPDAWSSIGAPHRAISSSKRRALTTAAPGRG